MRRREMTSFKKTTALAGFLSLAFLTEGWASNTDGTVPLQEESSKKSPPVKEKIGRETARVELQVKDAAKGIKKGYKDFKKKRKEKHPH